MHARHAAQAVLDHFRLTGVPSRQGGGRWSINRKAVQGPKAHGDVELVLADFDDGSGIEIETMNISPLRQTGLGTEVMEVVAAYCRPRGARIYLHSVEPAVPFYRRFQWLRRARDDSGALTRGFHSVWEEGADEN